MNLVSILCGRSGGVGGYNLLGSRLIIYGNAVIRNILQRYGANVHTFDV